MGIWDVALLLLLGYHCLLRTAEMCTLRVCHLLFAASASVAIVVLEDTKTGQRLGITDTVTASHAMLVQLLKVYAQGLAPGDFLLRRSVRHLRVIFNALLHEAKLQPGAALYSCRRGGATHFFRHAGSMGLTMLRGRWNTERAARLYINAALADRMFYALEPNEMARLEQLAGLLPRAS